SPKGGSCDARDAPAYLWTQYAHLPARRGQLLPSDHQQSRRPVVVGTSVDAAVGTRTGKAGFPAHRLQFRRGIQPVPELAHIAPIVFQDDPTIAAPGPVVFNTTLFDDCDSISRLPIPSSEVARQRFLTFDLDCKGASRLQRFHNVPQH